MKLTQTRAIASSATVATLLLFGLSPTQATEVVPDKVSKLAPEVLEDSILAEKLTQSSDGSLSTTTADGIVVLPGDSSQPAVISTEGQDDLTIKLPVPDVRADAIIGADGEVLYDNEDGSFTSAFPKDDGSLQLATTIESSSAPSNYRYELGLPAGSTMNVLNDGSVAILAEDGSYSGGVSAPWAKDASGQKVPTHYVVDGSSLIQVVDHSISALTVYPVVADPWVGIDLYQTPWLSFVSQGYKINVRPTSWGEQNRDFSIWWAHRDEVVTKLGINSGRWTNTIQEQFYCHINGWPSSLPVYNLDSWRPTVNWSQSLYQYRCNPYDGAWS